MVCGIAMAVGFACCAAAMGLGVTLEAIHDRFPDGIGFVDSGEFRAKDVDKSFTGITEIEAELFAGEVSILATDASEIRVETSDLSSRLGFRCYTEGSTLKLETKKKLFHRNNVGRGKIKVYIPRGTRFQEASFEMGAGTLSIEEICADDFSVNVGAGEVEITDFQAHEGALECGAGVISAKGLVESDLDISCGVGEIEFTAYGRETDYDYDIDCAVGEVVCGSMDFSGIGGNRIIDNGAGKEMDISTGVGSVTVYFAEAGTHHEEDVTGTHHEEYETSTHHEEHE